MLCGRLFQSDVCIFQLWCIFVEFPTQARDHLSSVTDTISVLNAVIVLADSK